MNLKKLFCWLSLYALILSACSSGGEDSSTDASDNDGPVFNYKVYYSDTDITDGNTKLHEYNFSNDEIRIIGNGFYDEIDSDYTKLSPIIINYKDKIYFSATTATTGFELWVYDPKMPEAANENPKMLVELNSGTTDTFPFSFFATDEHLYFGGRVPGEGFDFYIYDDTQDLSASNPQAVIVRPGGSNSEARWFFEYDDKIYFSSRSAAEGKELWVFDPSQPASSGVNPTILADINPSGDASTFYHTELNGKLYFQANTATSGVELWVYDSNIPVSASNPSLVVDLNSGTDNSSPEFLATEGDLLYFFATTPDVGRELRVYNPDLPVSSSNPLTQELISGISGVSVRETFYSSGSVYFSSDFSPSVSNAFVIYDPSQAFDISSNPQAFDPNGDNPASPSPEYMIECGGNKICFSTFVNGADKALTVFDETSGERVFEIKASVSGTDASDFVSYQEEVQ